MTNAQIDKLLVGFKPQFGNINHIKALTIINKFRKKNAGEEITEDEDAELTFEEKNLEFLLK